MSITASEARRRLFPLIEAVNSDRIAVEIVARTSSAYLVSAAEYEALRETACLLRYSQAYQPADRARSA
jgi:antitoxin YefM